MARKRRHTAHDNTLTASQARRHDGTTARRIDGALQGGRMLRVASPLSESEERLVYRSHGLRLRGAQDARAWIQGEDLPQGLLSRTRITRAALRSGKRRSKSGTSSGPFRVRPSISSSRKSSSWKSKRFLGCGPIHRKQVLSYLKTMDLRIGLLMNFSAEVLKQGLRKSGELESNQVASCRRAVVPSCRRAARSAERCVKCRRAFV